MNTIKLTKQEIILRGGILDEMMNKLFDVSILVDENCRIIHISDSSFKDLSDRTSIKGADISVVDSISPFRQVIETGRPALGLLLNIHGGKCVSNVYPIEDRENPGKIIGAIGTIVYRKLASMKKIFAGEKYPDELYSEIARATGGYSFDDFIGETPAVKDLIDKAAKAAGSNMPVLIIGETGTGKEIISGAIHNSRYSGSYSPYITINCTAIPDNLLESELFGHEKGAYTGADSAKPGKFELAAGGDILLDEIGDMDMQMQSKLLRVLESKEFERVGGSRLIPLQAGIIASTNKNLFMLSEEKAFRADLYFRLNTLELFVPPLRNRPGDIPLLFDHFCEQNDINLRTTPDAMRMLQTYGWPGNVRQLRNIVNRLSVFCADKQITSDDIALELRVGQRTLNEAFGFAEGTTMSGLTVMEENEKSTISVMLKNNGSNLSATARDLGISRGTLYNKMKKYGIKNI